MISLFFISKLRSLTISNCYLCIISFKFMRIIFTRARPLIWIFYWMFFCHHIIWRFIFYLFMLIFIWSRTWIFVAIISFFLFCYSNNILYIRLSFMKLIFLNVIFSWSNIVIFMIFWIIFSSKTIIIFNYEYLGGALVALSGLYAHKVSKFYYVLIGIF